MNQRLLVTIFALCLPSTSLAIAISFDHASSSWGGSGTFFDVGGGNIGTSALIGGTTAFASGNTDGTFFSFGFANTAPSSTAHYNLSSTDLTVGTSLNLVFTGLSSAPNYVAITGGSLTAYNYNSGTLTLTTSTVNPVRSASDTTGSTLSSAFGLILDYGGSTDLSGTVFQTNMFWGDVDTAASDYSGDTPIASVNADGYDGFAAEFIAHLSVEFLQANGINSPNDCIALVQKTGGSYNITIERELYADTNPYGNEGYTYIAASTFDFDGSGDDAYVKATYSNSVWSDGNIGITAVPEPSTYALILGSLSLIGIVVHRRRRA